MYALFTRPHAEIPFSSGLVVLMAEAQSLDSRDIIDI
jgi:hypothetical protein